MCGVRVDALTFFCVCIYRHIYDIPFWRPLFITVSGLGLNSLKARKQVLLKLVNFGLSWSKNHFDGELDPFVGDIGPP